MTRAVNTALAGSGGVLQVVRGQLLTSVSNSSATYADSGLSVTITPSSSDSKILILTSIQTACAGSAGINASAYFNVCRGATQLFEVVNRTYDYSGGVYLALPGSMVFLDSPATTSPTIYKVQLKAGATTGYINNEAAYSYITVMEVAG